MNLLTLRGLLENPCTLRTWAPANLAICPTLKIFKEKIEIEEKKDIYQIWLIK
jgi:hypothetical protein